MRNFGKRKILALAFFAVLAFFPASTLASDAIYATTLGITTALSRTVTAVYENFVVDPLSTLIYNLAYNQPEVVYLPVALVHEAVEEEEASTEPVLLAQADAPIVRTAEPVSDFDLVEKIREILRLEYENTGAPGPQGPQGEQGPQGPRGQKGDTPDISHLVTQDLFDAQTDGSLTSIENAIDGLRDDLEEEVSSESFLLTGEAGTITVVPAAAGGSYTLTMPTDDGTAGQMLTTDGDGILSWSTVAASPWTESGSDIYFTGGNVGVGTNAPAHLLDVRKNNATQRDETITLGGSFEDVDSGHAIVWRQRNINQKSAFISSDGASSGDASAVLSFGTSSNMLTTDAVTRMVIDGSGRVGIGDSSPNSLFTVGSGDLFQINSSGQIGSQQAPQSDYLFALKGTSSNDNSRIVDIVQENDSNEDSLAVSVVNNANLGSVNPVLRTVKNIYSSMTPTFTLFNSGGVDRQVEVYGIDQSISLSNQTLGNAGGYVNVGNYGNSVSISGTPVFNDISGGDYQTMSIIGQRAVINVTPTLTSIFNADISSMAGYFDNQMSSPGNANLSSSSYGVFARANGDLTTTGTTNHYGGYFSASGTADTNYGIVSLVGAGATNNYGLNIDVTGGTNNYGIFITNPPLGANNYALYSGSAAQSHFAGNVGIGDTTPDAKLDIEYTNSTQGSTASAAQITVTDSGGMFEIGGNNIEKSSFKVEVADSGSYITASPTTVEANGILASYNFSGATDTDAEPITFSGIKSSVTATLPTINSASAIFNGFTADVSGDLMTANGSHSGLDVTVSGSGGINSGVKISSVSGASVGNYGVFITSPSAASNNYAIYSSSPAQSYFAGNVGIGDLTPDEGSLTVMGTGQTAVAAFSGSDFNFTQYTIGRTSVDGDWFVTGSGGGQHSSLSDSEGDIILMASTSDLILTAQNSTGDIIFGTGSLGVETEKLKIDSGGNIGIGEATPDQKLHVVGGVGDTTVVRIETSGGNACDFDTTSGGFLCASDERLKRDIEGISSESALSKIAGLNPVTFHYNWQDDGEPLVSGFIAQEFEEVFPDMVRTDPDTGYKSLSYAGLMPYAIKGIQELDLSLESIALPLEEESELSYAERFFGKMAEWLGEAGNGVAKIFSDEVETKTLCVADESGERTCITKAELDELLSGSGQANAVNSGGSSSPQEPELEPEPVAEDESPAPEETVPDTQGETAESESVPEENAGPAEETPVEPEPATEETPVEPVAEEDVIEDEPQPEPEPATADGGAPQDAVEVASEPQAQQ